MTSDDLLIASLIRPFLERSLAEASDGIGWHRMTSDDL